MGKVRYNRPLVVRLTEGLGFLRGVEILTYHVFVDGVNLIFDGPKPVN